MSTLKDFVKTENERLEKEKKEWAENQNFPGFWVPKKGENKFDILNEEPRNKTFSDGKKKIIFRIQTGGENKDWAINPKNPIYKATIERLEKGQTSFVLLCTGQSDETRYEYLDK